MLHRSDPRRCSLRAAIMPKSTSFAMRWARFLLPLLVVLAAACGPTPPPRPPVRELPAPASALLTLAPPAYAQLTAVQLPEDQNSAAAQQKFAELAGPNAVHEPALDLVAAVVGKTYAQENELPARALLQWLYWKCGSISMPGPVNVVVAPAEQAALFQEHIRRLAAVVPQVKDDVVSFGVARVMVMGHVAQAIALGYRKVDMSPTPKSQPAGQNMPVRIALKKPYTNLTLYVDQGGPAVLSVAMDKQADGTYLANAPMPAAPGRYFIEVVGMTPPADGSEKGYRSSVLWLPFHVGVEEAAMADEFIRHPQKNHADRSAWVPQVLSAYNDARQKLGRPALTTEQAATALIQARADLIASRDDLPPPETQMPQKLAAAGLPSRNLFGFLDEIEYVSEYITLRLLRPAARFALFDPNVTTIALGIAPRTAGPMKGLMFSTAEYVFEVIRVDPQKERERILKELDALHGSAFTRNEPLTTAAQKIADGVCKGGPLPTDANAMFKTVTGLDPSLKNRLAAPWAGYELGKEDLTDIAKDAVPYTNVGIGVCQGNVNGNQGAEVVLMMFAGP